MAGVVVVGGLAVAGWGQKENYTPAPVGNPVPGESMQGLKVAYPPFKPVPAPFPLGKSFGTVTELEYRAPEAMNADDRLMVENAQPEIARRAELVGLRLTELTGWGYEQAVCPAFPDHVILEYSRLGGDGDVSLFSVVVPRGSMGHVRVIPVRRRGYSLWTSASSNALTLNDFNHLVKEGGLSPDWEGISLCYAALAAGHVRTALVAQVRADEKFPLTAAPLLMVDAKKAGAEVRLMDAAAAPGRKGEWILVFDGAGRLLKVKKEQAFVLRPEPVQGISGPAEFHGEPTAAP